jgi:DNA-binding SARP family transcriptional activator
VELGVLGPLQVRKDGVPVVIPGAKPRAILTMLGLHSGSIVSAETLIELLWGDDPPRTAAKALPTHISSLRRALGDGFVLTEGTGWALAESEVDASRYESAARLARDAAAAGDTGQAVSRFAEALALWRGIPELPDGRRGTSEKTRWIEGHAALVEDRADALLATGRAAEIIGELEAAVAEAPLRERRWGQLMLALYRAGRQGDALGAYQRARTLLADELGIDPGPELRRLEAAIVAQDAALEIPAAQDLPTVTRTVTFLLTDIEGSTAAWEADADAMAVALVRHDELVEQIVTSRGGRLIKTRGEGDATFSVFERASAAAAAAIELQDAIFHEPWALQDPMRIRVALHTGEVELRDGDYFGRAVNRAARLRSLAIGGQILCSGAIAELVIDSLPDDVVLADLGLRQLKNLARPEHVFELRLETASDVRQPQAGDEPLERPGLPAVLTGPGPFVGRGRELERLVSAWQTALAGGTHAVLIAGEPGVGKTRLAGEWSQQAYQLEAIVLYGRCDEDLGAPYQPFAEALRSLVPCLGTTRLRGVRGVEALLPLVPGLIELLPDLAAPTRADPETERYALFDAVVALLEVASAGVPVVLILDDLHWAAKPTLLLLRHLLRFGDRARVQIVGTYRSTDLDRSHPLAAMLADLHRGAGSGTANRLTLSGLDEADVTTYVTEAGYHDEELARALASVTGGNPFFLIEALRHVDETGGVWDPTTLPQGVRETVSRRLSRLPAETNTALAAAAVVGSRFALDLVEKVVEQDLVDPFDEACKAGIVIEEPGGRYRFNHAIVRQSLLAELPSVRRMRLHQRIATTLENEPGADDELLAELAHHYFECAWAGNAAKAVEYCRRAADQAVARLAYEGAADLYGQALHALDEIDDELPDRDDQAAELLVARCEALLAAGDVASAAGAVSKLQEATVNSARLAAWATCFDGQLSMLIHPERLDEVETALGMAAQKLAELDDAAGEANAHTVRAACLARLGRIGDGEIALDDALTAARRARDHRRVNAVLAGAPLAALWGPNPVPRAGGRCLDVVRLLRITTDSPAVEATSTRCQAVLEAFRGRAEAARRMIDSARRTVTELGLRHALLEVEQFAGIVELIADDPTAAEPHFRQAYNGFRRMGLDADTAETAALLGGTCLALDRHTEADELCLESEQLAGHALKASIAWRTLRARLLSRGGEHGEARRIAEAAVALAERTDALVDHGDACASLATVLGAAGDAAGARAAAERAVDLYERKGAAALAEKARRVVGQRAVPTVPAPPEPPPVTEFDNACVRAGERVVAAVNREAWDEFENLFAPEVFVESHRKVVGFTQIVPPENWAHENRRILETGGERTRFAPHVVAVRGERLALARVTVGTADVSPGAPHDEFLQVYGVDEEGRISLQIWFDLEDMDAAVAELDAAHARFEEEAHRHARRLENAASQASERYMAHFAARDWDELAKVLADDISVDDRRRVVNAGTKHGRDAEIANLRAAADVGITYLTSVGIAARGERLFLARVSGSKEEFFNEVLGVIEINSHNQIAAIVVFELDDFEAAIAELDARYLAGEAAAHAHTWSVISGGHGALNRREFPPLTPDCVSIDHRRGAAFAPGELTAYFRAGFDLNQDIQTYVEVVHRLSDLGAVCTHAAHGVSHEGFDAEWRGIDLLTIDGDMVNRCEVFDEADLDAALARFDQLSRPAPRLENAASQAVEHYVAHFAARDWDVLAKVLADGIVVDDRRLAVNAGLRLGRDAEIADMRAIADAGFSYMAFVVIAARGERLLLARASVRDNGSEEFVTDVLAVVEINSDNQITAIVVLDPDDFEAAIAELDTRYLAGEAAAHAHTWSVIAGAFPSLIRHELPPTTPDWVNLDHRRGIAFAPGDMTAYIRAKWDVEQDLGTYIEAVYRLNNLGAVFVQVLKGTSQEGFDAEWRIVELMAVEGDLISRGEIFDETDLDAALARFDQLGQPAPRLENAASRAAESAMSRFATRDWGAVGQVFADDIVTDDRRHTANAGHRHGRAAEIENWQAAADVGFTKFTPTVVATRGGRLALARFEASGDDRDAIRVEFLIVIGIDAEERIVALVAFELDDFAAAIAELDARYLAGEAAAHGNVLQPVIDTVGELNRHEPGPMLARLSFADHRRVPFGSAENYGRAIEELWALVPDARNWMRAVHALDAHGLVSTLVIEGADAHGNELQWLRTFLFLSDGPRVEVYEEADLDVALARFEELRPQARRLDNAASKVAERHSAYFAARDWDALAKVLADDFVTDDRRRAVNAGIRHGRDAEIANMQAAAEVGVTYTAFVVIATRGERLILAHASVGGGGSAEFATDVLSVVEVNSHNQIAAFVIFELDDFDAAIAELDARYLAGEAAAHAGTWSVFAAGYAALNRHELPGTTPDCVSIDHRRGAAFAPGELIAYSRANLDTDHHIRTYVEAVHRLSDLGVVYTHVGHDTSHEGFDAEWRVAFFCTVQGDLVNRVELFDETDLEAAVARFDELSRPAPRLENAASRVADRALGYFATRDWEAIGQVLADDHYSDDRRRVVNAGLRHGRDAEIENWRAAAEVGFTNLTQTVVATRGGRLVLAHLEASGSDPTAIRGEFLVVTEIDADERIVAFVVFEFDDLEAASAELDARYVAGEAAAHSHTWSVVTQACAALNRREQPPTTPDWVNIDHRRGTPYASGEMSALLDAAWNFTTDLSHSIAAVHRLSDLGAVVTSASHETSQEGFAAEWRVITVATVQGEMLNRCEVFDEADLDTALARFDALSRPAPRLENAASRVDERFAAYFAARDWDAMAELTVESVCVDDRRHVVNAGVRHGRDAEIANLRARAETGMESITSAVVAVRGERLALTRTRFWGHDQRPEDFHTEAFCIIEIDSDARIVARVGFDLDDFAAAVAELDARYLAGEAAPFVDTWSVVKDSYAALNRHEVFATTSDWMYIDHRPIASFEASDLAALLSATWDLAPDTNTYVEAVHRLADVGVVLTHAAYGTSREGFDAEWRMVALLTVDGNLMSRGELFDEADLDAALARFDELSRPALRLENTATRVFERLCSYFATGDWHALAQIAAENVSIDDRRRVVNAEPIHGRDAAITAARATVDVGFAMTLLGALATRGDRLALAHVRAAGSDPDAIQNDVLEVVEIDAEERIARVVVFDVEDFAAATTELDARYIAGEAAAHAGTWSVITGRYAAFNRHEVPATEDWVTIDHRRATPFEPSNMTPSIRTIWDLTPDLTIHIEAVHRLNNSGAVITHHGHGSSQEGFDAEWQAIDLLMVDGDRIHRCEVFDETDLEAALATFDQLGQSATRLENTASRVDKRFQACFAARDWNAMAEMLSDGFSVDDRRRVVNAGSLQGRDAELIVHAYAALGSENVTSTVVATRAHRLALSRYRFSDRDPQPDAFRIEMLVVVEIDANERMAAAVVFDVDDFEGAIAELDARYLAGEAAAHAAPWSVITGFFAAHNRREIAATTTDAVSLDHRRGAAFAPGEGFEYISAGWDLGQNLNIYIEAAHRVNDLAAVFTFAGYGTSREGFEAEWRGVTLMTVDGEMVSRMEVFDEEDLDAALAKFEELSRPVTHLENAASQVAERFLAHFAAADWDAMAEMLADNFSRDDRRRVVGAGIRDGRDAWIVDMRATADLWIANVTSTVIATRGERLVLIRGRFSHREQVPDGFLTEFLTLAEINADEWIAAIVMFDPDDIDAAFAELDARYLAGEAAPHAHAWSVIARTYAVVNRQELPVTPQDWVDVDHRHVTKLTPGDWIANLRAAWEQMPDLSVHIDAVHRLTDLGAVFSFATKGTSTEGFEAEWRTVNLMTVEGDLINRSETFDEADLDAALARFEELHPQTPRLENAASRLNERFLTLFAAGDWDAIAEMTAEGFSHDDRRPVVGAGVQHGRDAYIVDMRAVVELWNTNVKWTVVAIRGERLVLTRNRLSGRDQGPEVFFTEVLAIGEINADERAVAVVTFDVDDIDAAFEELDARYLAGEAAPYRDSWSVIAAGYAALNRYEVPPSAPDYVNIDHRLRVTFEVADLGENLRTAWDLTPELKGYVEVVHRLSRLGAVVTHAAHGTTKDGLDVEWRTVHVLTLDAGMVNRAEVFDEANLDSALARFEELDPPTPRLENAASRITERLQAHFAAGEWTAMAEMLADNVFSDDRRRVVNAGIRRGRDAALRDARANAELGLGNVTSTVLATRGERLVLRRARYSSEAFHTDILSVFEIDSDDRVEARVVFDHDDTDAAFAELDARYLAGEAAAYSRVWSAITTGYAALNRHEVPATTPDWVNVDHRRGIAFESGELAPYIRATFDVAPDIKIRIEVVHRLTSFGAVISYSGHGTSQEGFDAVWRETSVFIVDGDLVSHCEMYDEADVDAALARLEELSLPALRLKNSVAARISAHIAARDWRALAQDFADDYCLDDRRRVVNAGVMHGRDAGVDNTRVAAEIGLLTNTTSTIIASRGERLTLERFHASGPDHESIQNDALNIVEIDADARIAAVVMFDVDDIDGAFAELEARYIAGEAAAHAQTWSRIARAYAALNRHEVWATTPDWVAIDHSRLALAAEAGNLPAFFGAIWDLTPQFSIHIEAVHRLSNLGAVYTHVASGTSPEGFEAEWRMVELLTFEGDLINRGEIFDESDLDAALARFEELQTQAPRLENAASRTVGQFFAHFGVCDWDAMAELLAEDVSADDRRGVVNAGVRRGRDLEMANWRATEDIWTISVRSTIATRGERLALVQFVFTSKDSGPEAFSVAAFAVVEINDDDRIAEIVVFHIDDVDAAFAELDARYLAGEAAGHAHTWSVISHAYAALNRRELPATTRDWTSIDHRRFDTIEANALTPNISAFWDMMSKARIDVATVHRLTNFGGVVAHATHATSHEGVEIESAEIIILMVDGDLLSRCEIFDEADLDAALARFVELSRPARRLENAASRLHERFLEYYAAGDSQAMAEMLAHNYSSDDRRPVVGSGVRHGRDAHIADMRARAELWNTNLESTVMAIRGERLVLMRIGLSDRDEEPEAFSTEVLAIGEIDADERALATVTFDVDDVDAAFAELDARYLAGEAAPHAHTWSVIAGMYAGFNRRERPATTPDSVFIDHRPIQNLGAVDLVTATRSLWDLAPDLNVRLEAAHRLSELGAVVTQTLKGTSQEGFDAEWRTIEIYTVEGDMLSHCEVFDEADLDAALARFDEMQPRAPHLENAASRVDDRFGACFPARDWVALAEILADDTFLDDRRRVVGIGVRQGRDVQIADFQAAADRDITPGTTSIIATRGERLALSRVRVPDQDQGPEAFYSEVLDIVEIDTDERIVARFLFAVDDIDAAFAELDARYLAGEAAAHARTWSAIAGVYVAFNRRELPAPDYITVDHRRATLFTSNELATSIRDSLDLTPDLSIHIEAVHQLNNFGAVLTNTSTGTSHEGFDAEWRMIQLLTVEGDRVNRLELFDEADLDAALARLEELQPQAPRLENAASRVDEQLRTRLAARDWDAMANLLTEDTCTDDRRRIVNVGIRRGRDVTIAYSQAMADLGVKIVTSEVVAIRGERLFLSRARWLGPDQGPEDFHTEVLNVVEIDLEQRIAARVMFDPDNIDAAFEELDARYLTGEAAAHAQTWSVIARECAAFNRHELTAADYVTIDHRPLAIIDAADPQASTGAIWDVTPDFTIRIEAAHRLSGFGAVATYTASGTSPDGFDAEWRIIELLTVEGDLINRCEVFDESDLDAALARFEELQPQAPRLENPASQIVERYLACISAGDWAAMAEVLADDIVADDRRHVVNAGVRRGRDVHITDMQATVDVSAPTFSSSIIATRGERLALAHVRIFNRGMTGEVGAEALGIGEIDADERLVAAISFDLDDIGAAFAELDARYLAGEAAPHAHAWSVITGGYAAFNRREVPQTTQDWVSIDHRRAIAFAPGQLNPYMQATWDMAPDVYTYAEAAHRLSNLGAVITQVSRGTSQQGFDGEWREIVVVTVEGDLVNRIEIFEEADLDAALARFDEMQPQTPRLENAASQVVQRFLSDYVAGEWEDIPQMLADDFSQDDRRRVVGAGVRHGRDAQIVDMQTIANLRITDMTSVVTAIRGERLVLVQCRFTFRDQGPQAFVGELFGVAEINAHDRAIAAVLFDLDDIDAAFAELEARYLAGEAAAHAQTWSVIARTYAAFNRHEFPSTTPNSVYIDHRPLVTNDATDLTANIRAIWDLMDVSTYTAESVHRLSELGAVVTQSLKGTSKEGLDIESRMIDIFTVEGDRLTRCEVFDEADLDVALARFDQLSRPTPRLENAASRAGERLLGHFAASEWDGMAEMLADNLFTDDRRRVVGAGVRHGREAQIADFQAMAGVWITNVTPTIVATRGERLALQRARFSDRDHGPEAFLTETPGLGEINADERFVAFVTFDIDDIDAAFAELDARYIAGEAAAHARTWSVITQAYAALNRHEVPPTARDCAVIDHRRAIAFAGDIVRYVHGTWDVTPDAKMYIEAVHRLTNRGAVVTWATYGRSQEGFDAEWRGVNILTVEGDLIDHGEIFDEADLDTALARFDELQPRRLENAASQLYDRFQACLAARDWDAMTMLMADDISHDDRRRVVNAGLRHGLDVGIKDLRAVTDLGLTNLSWTAIATRGERLILTRARASDRPEMFLAEVLSVTETNANDRIAAFVTFDPEDIDAAFEELDARYLAGEAAAHAHAWSVIARLYVGFNDRHELPATTPDLTYIDHRPLITVEASDLPASIRAIWDLTPEISIYMEAVHRLSDVGAVVTHTARGISHEDFEAEWRLIAIFTVEGDLISRCEMFDEADLDAALARFDELEQRTASLENVATRVWAGATDAVNRRDMDGLLALATVDHRFEDRRKGLRDLFEGPVRGREAVRALFETIPSSWRLEVEPIAIRGSRLSLTRACYRDIDVADRPIAAELLQITEVGDDDLVHDFVNFDPDDVNGAFAELTARWIASGEVSYPEVIESVDRINATINRHDWDAVATYFDGAEYVNHRQLAQAVNGTIADWLSSMQTTGSLVPNFWVELAEVLARSAIGIVGRMALKGTSTDRTAIEIPFVVLILLRGERVTRLEAFDEDQRDLALARLQEFNRPV